MDYRLAPRLSVGIERSGGDVGPIPWPEFGNDPARYLSQSNGDTPVMPRASWFAVMGGLHEPSLTFGMTSDRLSTPRGQAFFATSSYNTGTVFTPFVSVKYDSHTRGFYFPFGANLGLGHGLTLQTLYDGNYTHFLLSGSHDNMSASLILARGKHLGLMFSYGF